MGQFRLTVYEYHSGRIAQLQQQIQDLQDEIHISQRLCSEYANSQMLEAERVATQAEKFLKPIQGDYP